MQQIPPAYNDFAEGERERGSQGMKGGDLIFSHSVSQ